MSKYVKKKSQPKRQVHKVYLQIRKEKIYNKVKCRFLELCLLNKYLMRTKGAKINQSPKGNMWSAIPVALLCMLVIVGDGKQGSGPKGDDVEHRGTFVHLRWDLSL